MKPQVTATLQHSPLGPTTKLGTVEFEPSPIKPSLLMVEKTLQLPKDGLLRLSGNLETENLMMSVAGFLNEEHVFLMAIKWDTAAPYFGFSIRDIGWFHFYFEKNPLGTRNEGTKDRN